MPWRVITYRLPAEPSRHRVAVWRELRRLGAVSLQQGTWAVPDGEPFEAGLRQVVEAIKVAGGQPVVLAVAEEEASAAQLEELFTAQREAEWAEFVSDCGKYETELAGEVAKGKLTLAELDEEEQSRPAPPLVPHDPGPRPVRRPQRRDGRATAQRMHRGPGRLHRASLPSPGTAMTDPPRAQ